MKKIILFICSSFFFDFTSVAQKCKPNIYTDWYANIGKKDYWNLDTLILYKNRDSLINEVEMIRWMYVAKDRFRPVLLLNTMDGLVDPAYLWINKWKLRSVKGKNKLTIKDDIHLLRFMLNDYYIADTLYKIVLIKMN